MSRNVVFLKDLIALAATHPRWFIHACVRKSTQVRAVGTARYKYDLAEAHHEDLDARLSGMEVQIGGSRERTLSHSKAFIVSRFCKLLAPARVLEIGTFRGTMTYHIARNTGDDCRIWTTDLPTDALAKLAGEMISSDVQMASMARSDVGGEFHGRPEASKITQLWGDSQQFDFSPFAPFDLIYIDGSHAEPAVEKDTENAFRFLSPTGAILWDDCYWSDVQKVLSRWSKSKPIYLFEDGETAGYLQKNGQPVKAAGVGR